MNWLRTWYRHHYKTHYRTPHMARMVSWQANACGVRTVVTNCTHGDCGGWIVLQREEREMATPQIKPLAQLKREAAANAVACYLGDKVKAAAALGISLQTLRSYLKGDDRG